MENRPQARQLRAEGPDRGQGRRVGGAGHDGADRRPAQARFFAIEQSFPTAYNWNLSHPRRPWLRAPQERVSVNVPFIGCRLAVDYCYRCTPRSRVPAGA
jgi:hypothetical protein